MRCFLTGLVIILSMTTVGQAAIVAVSFTKLTGVTGGSPAGTAVYVADLTGTGIDIQSIRIRDNSFGLGGAAGQFSGFDLDAIKLSNTLVGDAAGAQSLAGLAVFDFSPAGTVFSPGTQRVPIDPKLFGTDASGNRVDNAVATLGAFGGNSTTAIPGAFGFVSMGDGGILGFNLTSQLSTSGLYLYIGEVGDNGEVAAGSIEVSNEVIPAVPERTTLIIWSLLAGLGMGLRRWRKCA